MGKNVKRRGVGALLVGLAASGLTAAALTTGALGAFTASILNDTNTLGSGVLIMREQLSDGSIVCESTDGGTINSNSATCSTINKYGGVLEMSPTGDPVSTSVIIENIGTATAQTFTLTAGACTQSNNGTYNGTATDFCSMVNVRILEDGVSIYDGTAAALAGTTLTSLAHPVPPNMPFTYTFEVSIDETADNTYQGLQASQPLTWTFTA